MRKRGRDRMTRPPTIAAEQVTPPVVSLEIEALSEFVAQRPWLADLLECEIHRLWGGQVRFERPAKTGEASMRAVDPLAMSACAPPARNTRRLSSSRR